MAETPIPFSVRVIDGTVVVGSNERDTVVVQEDTIRVVRAGTFVSNTFAGLADTDFSALTAFDLVQFDGTNWVNIDPSTVGVTDHFALTNIGVNTHVAIDSHIADTDIHFADAPVDAQTYARRDAAWVEIQTGGALISGVWRFETSTATAPASGRFRQDNAAYASVVEIFIADTTRPGFDATNILTALSPGDRLYIQNENDASEWVIWDVDGAVTDEGTWFRIPVNLVNNGDTITNNRDCLIAVLFGGGVGGLSHFDLTDIGVNTHAAIDTHIADGTIHFTEASIDHTAIANIGANSHAAIDTHIGDGTIHFTLEDVDDQVDGLLQDVEGLTWDYDDGANTLTPVLAPALAMYKNLDNEAFFWSDFGSPPSSLDAGPFRGIAAGFGGLINTNFLFDNHPGIWCLSTGAVSAAGRVFVLSSFNLGTVHFGVNEIRCVSWMRTSAALSTALQRYTIRSGWSSMNLPNTILFGVTFEYIDSENGGRWQAITHDGVETSTDTGVTVVADTWYKLEIIVNAAGTSVEFLIDDVSVATNTTNIPSGTGFQVFHSDHIMKTIGTAFRTVYLDACGIWVSVTR